MSVHVHLGVEPERIDKVRDLLGKGPDAIYVDGDGWECWGEAPGTDVNNSTTMHMIFELPWESKPNNRQLLERTVEKVVKGLQEYLTPMQVDHQTGIIACLSDSEDWSTLDGGPVRNYRQDE